MMKARRTLLAAALLLVAIAALWLGPASAQEGIRVWPTMVELSVVGGVDANETVFVENAGEEPVRVRAYIRDFWVDADRTFTFSQAGAESYSASTWIRVVEPEFEIAAGDRREVVVEISVPREVEPGGHYAAVFFETVPSSQADGISVATRIPCLFYLTTPGCDGGDVFADAEIVSCIVPGVADGGPVETGVVVCNPGNVHVTVAAKAYFNDWWGRKSELDLGQVVVLPGSQSVLKGKWDEAPALGSVTTSFVIGYYDENGELVQKERIEKFLMIPWRDIAYGGAGILLLLAVALLLVRRYRLKLERR